MRDCAICGGTGKLVLMNSWFHSDGYRRERCGLCAGTGKSDARDPDWARAQKRLRERYAAKAKQGAQ